MFPGPQHDEHIALVQNQNCLWAGYQHSHWTEDCLTAAVLHSAEPTHSDCPPLLETETQASDLLLVQDAHVQHCLQHGHAAGARPCHTADYMQQPFVPLQVSEQSQSAWNLPVQQEPVQTVMLTVHVCVEDLPASDVAAKLQTLLTDLLLAHLDQVL
jgi:hypothetical protein